MAVDYDSFTSEERDNFVKFVLTEPEVKAAVFLATARGTKRPAPEEILEFCFRVAVEKMKKLHGKIREKKIRPTGN